MSTNTDPAWPPAALLKSARESVRQTCSRLGLRPDPQSKRALVRVECLIADGCKHIRLGGIDEETVYTIRSRLYRGQPGYIDPDGLPRLRGAPSRGSDLHHG